MSRALVIKRCARETCRPTKASGAVAVGQRNCGTSDAGKSDRVQPFPTEGTLFNNLDLEKPELQRRIGQIRGKVRSYKMISVTLGDEELLQQGGSGPNYQGGCLTLCNCQCVFRAEKKNPDEWLDDWWIAGFTSPKLCGRTWLFYLAQVGQAYKTQAELWKSRPDLRLAKSTRRNRLGDMYQPAASVCPEPFAADHYHPPMVGHSHRQTADDETWHNDIEFYHEGFGRHPVLLVADPEFTFLWQTPLLYVDSHPRNRTWESVTALVQRLMGPGGR